MPCQGPTIYKCCGEEDRIKYQKEIDKLTRMLCWLVRKSRMTVIEQNDELLGWWTGHKILDEERASKK